MNTTGRSEAIRSRMEIALPYRLHRHQHGPLYDPIPQARNAERPELAIRFGYIHASRGQRTIRARQQFFAYRRQFMREICFHHALVDTIHARRAGSAGCQRDTSRLAQPIPVGNQSQESIKLAFFVLRRPYRQFALHFTDYQRSSPHYGQLINPANHFNCLPSPCSRFSRPRTTTEAPPVCTSSGAHSLGIRADLPQFTCWTQRMSEVTCRSLYPCLPQVVANTTV